MNNRGADILAHSLMRAGTRTIYSLSGNQIMPVYDAAIDAEQEIIHVRHEGAAVHMADAHGRLTGEPGIAMVTGGPGHANALGALYTALVSDSPLVLLSGHAPLNQLGMDAFQEMRQADMASPVVKASWTAQNAAGLGQDVARAFRIAGSGRPGPVHVSLPFDVLEAKTEDAAGFIPAASAFAATATPLSDVVANTVLAELRSARRPLVIAGPMMASARGQSMRDALDKALAVPVVCMESPRGVNDPALGAFAEVLCQSDLVVLLAKRLDFTLRFGRSPAFAKDCRFIQIDPECGTYARSAKALGEPARIVLAAVADPFAAARALIARCSSVGHGDPGWVREVEQAIAFRPSEWGNAGKRPHGPLHPAEVGRVVQAAIDRCAETVLVIDGGEFGQWAQACVSASTRIINGPAGSIGSALPFALAAKRTRPNATVIAMLGDGTFGFHMAEFDTANRHGLPIVAIIGNDACWNAEHQIQLNTYGRERTFGCELLPARYDQAVASLGGHGEVVNHVAELEAGLGRAITSGKPACVNVILERLPAPTVTRSGAARAGGH
jgi:acetolactate synthase-1/2/3 large subunit